MRKGSMRKKKKKKIMNNERICLLCDFNHDRATLFLLFFRPLLFLSHNGPRQPVEGLVAQFLLFSLPCLFASLFILAYKLLLNMLICRPCSLPPPSAGGGFRTWDGSLGCLLIVLGRFASPFPERLLGCVSILDDRQYIFTETWCTSARYLYRMIF